MTEIIIFTRLVKDPKTWRRSRVLETQDIAGLHKLLATSTAWARKYCEIWVAVNLTASAHCYLENGTPVTDLTPDKNHAGFLIALLSAL